MNAKTSVLILGLMASVLAAGAEELAGTYAVDAVHSTAMFRIKHLGVSFARGRFNDIAGTISLGPDGGKVAVTIKTASVDTANEARDKHLRTADFFSTDEFPEMSFVSTSFKKIDEDTFEVSGDFTLHGVTKPLTVTAELTGTGKDNKQKPIAGFETEFVIKRSEFDMGKMVPFIGDEVRVTLSIEAAKQS